ncbi:hypothetical protein [Alteromonas gilva]|uniref:Glycosyltransferase n=1 Tax=Alteromonas gilva TaxID=2987522 RepID=A0ABT5L7I6_9ALTE|nr:hypothetical protein [Alteromonas gilva]MDC8833022.1 hypothetical protein [Alteromonas gilva]
MSIRIKNKRISFLRYYHGYTGGHQKVRDYLDHFVDAGWQPSLYLSNKAATEKSLFSEIPGVDYQCNYQPAGFDTIFLAGMDWQHYLPLRDKSQTVINLIQHVRHGDPEEPLFQYLQEPAIRLCVSSAVKEAIQPFANGPCYTIRMGHRFPEVKARRQWDLYILANKQADLGAELYDWATGLGFNVKIDKSTQEHRDVIASMAASAITVALPNPTEGFYLPGVEAMHYSKAAVVPYCVANREYFNTFANLFMPDYNIKAIKRDILRASKRSSLATSLGCLLGKKIASAYTLERERKELQNCLRKHLI